MLDLSLVKICALLHDIGKPECWAYEATWSDHVKYTYKIISETLGEELATIAMRHHASRYYSEEYHPKTAEEKIIHIADNISSGADRPEEPYKIRPRPKPPIAYSHPLSLGIAIEKYTKEDLKIASEEAKNVLKKSVEIFNRNPAEAYLKIFDELSRNLISKVPAYSEPPINDNSLFDHQKLTTAIATCIYLSKGYIGDDLEKYEFSLLSGDADKIGKYIDTSKRLPDLIAGSQLVKNATERAVDVIRKKLGPECIVYHGGGNFLALAPPNKAMGILQETAEEFEASVKGQLTITTIETMCSGKELQANFGKIWETAHRSVRMAKLERTPHAVTSIQADSPICDVCHIHPGEIIDPEYIATLDAQPRPEFLCTACYERRQLGRAEKGISLNNIAEKDEPIKLVGILKMDGDSVGKLFSGEKLTEYKKAVTPARLASLSRLVNDICERVLKGIVGKYGGACVYAGGDDILAILPARKSLFAALEMASNYKDIMVNQSTISAGLIITKPAHPLNVALQGVSQLLKNAKEEGKNGVDFEIIREIGYTPQDLDYEAREERKKKYLSGKPYTWKDFADLIKLTEQVKTGVATTQLRTLGCIISSGESKRFDQADFFIKRQFVRRLITYEESILLKK
ncbi:MAG: type III-B CRISPR-associated protein Cas10/Cmr2, partial [Candidatus Bathyarchaeia archaeon]